MNLCACGCSTEVTSTYPDGGLRRFVLGHNSRLQERAQCAVITCHKRVASNGHCGMHYQRILRHGTIHPVTARLDPERFFWSLVRLPRGPDGCWEWMGPVYPSGYGYFGTGKSSPLGDRLVHRISYRLRVGELIPGMHIDHTCRNTICVNPEHLEQVTVAENTRRGLHGVLRTVCAVGHRLTPENTYIRPSDNSRRCRICIRDEARARRVLIGVGPS